VKSSAASFVADVFEAIQRHGTRLRWSDEYIEVEGTAFRSGDVIGGIVKVQKRLSVATVDSFERLSVVFHAGDDHDLILTGATSDSLESEPYP
jgi:hypothetical protein